VNLCNTFWRVCCKWWENVLNASRTVHDDLIKHQPSPHGIWHGASHKLSPALWLCMRLRGHWSVAVALIGRNCCLWRICWACLVFVELWRTRVVSRILLSRRRSTAELFLVSTTGAFVVDFTRRKSLFTAHELNWTESTWIDVREVGLDPWASAHRGKLGQLTPWKKWMKNWKAKTSKKAVFYVYVIFWEQSGQAGVEYGAMLTTYLPRYLSECTIA